MGLTERKREFLEALRRLYQEQGHAVHYEDVARAVGVSKWTAYDMLRELAADGLVGVEYVLNRNVRMPGRSMIMFRPNDPGEGAGERRPKPAGRLAFGDELALIKKNLVASLSELRGSTSQGIWQGFMEDLDRANGPAAFCGYMAVLLVACTRLLGGNSVDVLARLVQAGADAHSALLVFSGAIMGMLLVHPAVSGETTGRMAAYMRRFQEQVDRLSGQERSLLLDFVREIARPV
ncbi:MAG TPA: hypothetical protein GX515_10355 [Firmicutes bacterium]|nr:hypothetical protein [Bacillota bacterium]